MYETKMNLLKDMEDFIATKISNKQIFFRWKYSIEEMGGYEKVAQNAVSWEKTCTLFGLYCKRAGIIE